MNDEIKVSPYSAPGIRSIDEIVADAFGVTVEGMILTGRKRENVDARHYAMWFRSKYTRDSYEKIGRIYSGKDHATVHHAVKKVCILMETDRAFQELADYAFKALEKAGYTTKKVRIFKEPCKN